MTQLDEAVAVIAKTVKEIERTILLGWPHDDCPSEVEAEAIQSTFDELSLQEPTLPEQRRWYLAGQIVARIRRDQDGVFRVTTTGTPASVRATARSPLGRAGRAAVGVGW